MQQRFKKKKKGREPCTLLFINADAFHVGVTAWCPSATVTEMHSTVFVPVGTCRIPKTPRGETPVGVEWVFPSTKTHGGNCEHFHANSLESVMFPQLYLFFL